ncbi:TTP [Lepeophtheirus salmonis]|uniref:TTP n=1 Tax=Lepeophtheirus salmonis TaxID=72036 RepID=A0A7R8CZ10_LEPSM|nr:TTP [Lepeophtheirus salmonis]CAF2972536.1 TTP [Lepeophtheirus salmonis]
MRYGLKRGNVDVYERTSKDLVFIEEVKGSGRFLLLTRQILICVKHFITKFLHWTGTDLLQPSSAEGGRNSSSRYKTEMCRNFKERSRCIYGEQCQFAHGRTDLRDVVRNTKYKTKLCQKYWISGGFIAYWKSKKKVQEDLLVPFPLQHPHLQKKQPHARIASPYPHYGLLQAGSSGKEKRFNTIMTTV